MHFRQLIPVLLFMSGIACIAVAVATGEADVSLFVIFPVFSGTGGLFLLGAVLIILSFVAGFALLWMGQLELRELQSQITGAREGMHSEKKVHYGGVVLLGPVPVAFGSNRDIAVVMLVVGIILAIVVLGLIALAA